MTELMVSSVAAWTCFADTLIEVADLIAHDGIIHETDNDISQPDYESYDPTHDQISDDYETQKIFRFYDGYDRQSPPQAGDDPQFLFLGTNLRTVRSKAA